MESFLNYHLPVWYPLVILGIYYWTKFLHDHDYELFENESADKVLSCISYILLFGSELAYFVFPHAGGGMFYYMDPDIVGWIVTIVAVFLTFVVVFKQFFHYIDFYYTLHEHQFVSYSQMIVFLLCSVIVILRMFGVYEAFLDEYMYHIIFALAGFHLVAIVILNFVERSHWFILLEIPLYIMGMFAFLLTAVVAVIFIVFSFAVKLLTASSGSGSNGDGDIQSCEDCVFYDLSERYCRQYGEKKNPHFPGEKAIYHASSCGSAQRR